MRGDRGTLLTLGAAVFVPLLLFVALQTAFGLRMQREQVEAQAAARAREVTALVDGQLWADQSALSVMANSGSVARQDWQTAYERGRTIDLLRPRWETVILTDARTKSVIWQTDAPLGASHALRPEVAAYLRANGVASPVSDMSPGVAPCPCMMVHAPVLENGELRYVLSAQINTRDFQDILMTGRLPGSVSAIVDRKGMFIARTLDFENKLGQPATPYVRNAIAAGTEGLYHSRTWEGLDSYTAFHTSQFSGISTHVAVASNRVRAPARGYLLMMTLAALITLGLAAAIAAFGFARYAERRREEDRRRQSQKLEALGQLAGGVAHDFNNLLMVILGNLTRLSEMTGDEALRRPIGNALAAAERGKSLTQQLLTFTRVKPAKTESVDLVVVLHGMRDLIAQSVGSGITVSVDIADDARMISANASELELALLNLAVNARDAMPGGGIIEINARRSKVQKDFIDMTVRDDGHGMSKAVCDRALEPFYTTKPPGKGTGLGLAQVLGLVTHSGGSIEIDSQVQTGTTVTLSFPAAKPD